MFTEVFNKSGESLGVIDITPKKLYKGKINHYGKLIDINYVYEGESGIKYYYDNEGWFTWYKNLVINE